jgi:hypothetical protein
VLMADAFDRGAGHDLLFPDLYGDGAWRRSTLHGYLPHAADACGSGVALPVAAS